jgi:hypothetical protein
LIESLNIYLEEQHKLNLYQTAVDNAVKEDKSKIKLEDKHPILIAMNDISSEEYVLQTLKKTKARYIFEFFYLFFKIKYLFLLSLKIQ